MRSAPNSSGSNCPERKSSYIALYNQNRDPADRSDWENQHEWLLMQLGSIPPLLCATGVKALGRISVSQSMGWSPSMYGVA